MLILKLTCAYCIMYDTMLYECTAIKCQDDQSFPDILGTCNVKGSCYLDDFLLWPLFSSKINNKNNDHLCPIFIY